MLKTFGGEKKKSAATWCGKNRGFKRHLLCEMRCFVSSFFPTNLTNLVFGRFAMPVHLVTFTESSGWKNPTVHPALIIDVSVLCGLH